MSVSLTLFLPPLGLSSSQVEVEMLHSAGVKGEARPVCRASRRADLPCRGGPTTSILNSLQGSAFRSCARRKASTDAGPEDIITPHNDGKLQMAMHLIQFYLHLSTILKLLYALLFLNFTQYFREVYFPSLHVSDN